MLHLLYLKIQRKNKVNEDLILSLIFNSLKYNNDLAYSFKKLHYSVKFSVDK